MPAIHQLNHLYSQCTEEVFKAIRTQFQKTDPLTLPALSLSSSFPPPVSFKPSLPYQLTSLRSDSSNSNWARATSADLPLPIPELQPATVLGMTGLHYPVLYLIPTISGIPSHPVPFSPSAPSFPLHPGLFTPPRESDYLSYTNWDQPVQDEEYIFFYVRVPAPEPYSQKPTPSPEPTSQPAVGPSRLQVP